MGDKIFLVDGDGLIAMNEQKYDSEARLQDLLTKYPDLLAGDQMESDTPRRFVLVKAEAGVPSEEGGSDTWSLDHLFVDQDGIPTLVEVKRSTDTRIRREVVGQMLDYAANSVVYWPIEEIRARFYAHWDDPEAELKTLLGDDFDEDQFWEAVATNLKAGKVRLVFLADAIPSELRRIVEFLGEQLTPAEVFAVEVKQFLGENSVQTLVPRVVAQTSRPKIRSPRARWGWDNYQNAGWSSEDIVLGMQLMERLKIAAADWHPEERFSKNYVGLVLSGKNLLGIELTAKRGLTYWFTLSNDPQVVLPTGVEVHQTKNYYYLANNLLGIGHEQLRQLCEATLLEARQHPTESP